VSTNYGPMNATPVPEIETPGPSNVDVAASEEPGLASDQWPTSIADVENPAEQAPEPSENE
jgi:hypothetical protein